MFLRAAVVAAAIVAAIGLASPAYSSSGGGGGGCYIASSGDCVPSRSRGPHRRPELRPSVRMVVDPSVSTRTPAELATGMAVQQYL
ncbi:hypothetical protein JMUB5695_01858 [Mycobacterium heckeshornense]|nr:hypothetical protein JMUB5695_01858 [Mycobacterium heckeshornense]